jgi:hypothetical protein
VAEGASAGADAGTLHVSGPALQLVKSEDGTVTYAQHAPRGTRTTTPGSLEWTIRWTAPAANTTVRFDIAANASNDDDSPLDDYIYVKSVRIPN